MLKRLRARLLIMVFCRMLSIWYPGLLMVLKERSVGGEKNVAGVTTVRWHPNATF